MCGGAKHVLHNRIAARAAGGSSTGRRRWRHFCDIVSEFGRGVHPTPHRQRSCTSMYLGGLRRAVWPLPPRLKLVKAG